MTPAARLFTKASVSRAPDRPLRLTPLRSGILEIVTRHRRPIRAYEILEQLSGHMGKRVFPPTVYRTLDYLTRSGVVKRIECLNAYVAILQTADTSLLFICNACGSAVGVPDPDIDGSLAKDADAAGFAIEHSLLEVRGLCRNCRSQADS
ncbi:Fur family transcriptional regulator [Telmatospirillum siberiense]|uniref:Fur family transcriptional regulator n=1 Tax=Telmatospirillum siberiense TaxID=382514 RepID=A0A2N3Q110_9PROT|nr:Fur family transcriptional regulator [Telmatospirillum siberiense]PKU26349.1 Fur family transcriptional regulator [Telmatospirillum siberiense]